MKPRRDRIPERVEPEGKRQLPSLRIDSRPDPAQVQSAREAVPVVSRSQHLTYGELDYRSNQLGASRWVGVGPEVGGDVRGASPE